LIAHLLRSLRFGPDPLRNGSVLLCLLVFLGGILVLGLRVRAAWRGYDPSRSLVVCRMIAVLGALGGFVVYLRDLPLSGARTGLALGGLAALPWAAVILLEGVRRGFRRGKGA
jgi:hypothetical protein